MIRVEKIEKDGKEGRDCTISGTNLEIAGDLDALFTAMSHSPVVGIILVERMHEFITSKATEILNKKGDK